MMRVALHWLRRDLRLHDNLALAAATREAATVIPVYVINPRLLTDDFVAPARVAALAGALSDLASELQRRGGRLIVRVGDTATELAQLAGETNAEALFANQSIGSRAANIEQQVADRLNTARLPLYLFDDVSIVPPDLITKKDGSPYTVYTPFSKRWREVLATTSPKKKSPHFEALRAGGRIAQSLTSADHIAAIAEAGYDLDYWLPKHGGGRRQALQRLAHFVSERLAGYPTGRDIPAEDGTSLLSPAFRWGMLSQREAWRAAQSYADEHAGSKAGAEKWIGELAWADFYRAILHYFPESEHRSFKPQYDQLEWEGKTAHLTRWQDGATGYPIVDAGMRQLLRDGWMHNRVRMIVASFLVKDLLLDWRLGEAHFMRHLADGDAAENVGGWQWAASTGTDAQPFFRIFHPVRQSERFDPQGSYIRRYLPELAQVPQAFIHAPWCMSSETQQQSGCTIGRDYPAPIVDHAAQRPRALAMFRKVRGRSAQEEDDES